MFIVYECRVFDFVSCCSLLVDFRFLAVFFSYGSEEVHLLGLVGGESCGLERSYFVPHLC